MSDAITAYAELITSGQIPAGKLHRLACARHIRDVARQGAPDFPYRYQPDLADTFFRFGERLKHYKGELAGQTIRFEDWQRFALGSVFAWVHQDTGLRRFRTAYNELPRKNGKTTMAATVALYMTFFSKEPGNEGYIVATKREQSKICFADAKRMVQSSGLRNRLSVQVGNIHRDDTACKLEPLGADSDSTDGLNPGFVCVDEMHAMKDRGMLDVMETATGARRQPLIFQITTAGDDPVSPCGDQHEYASKILEGVIADESFFCFIAAADPDDDWTTEETARKANPNYGVSVKPDDMRGLVLKAQNIPSAAAAYKQKRLGLWVNATAPCLSVDGWRKGQTTWAPADMRHESCYVGVDLASKLDLMALVFVFPPTVGRASWRLLPYVWTPEETLRDRAHRDRAPYDVWVERGWLHTTPGPVLDHGVIREVLQRHRADFDVERIGFDPWHADKLITELVQADGWDEQQVLAVPQTFQGLASAEAKFQAEVLAGQVDAGGSPLLAWCASNVVSMEDGKGNIQFTKKRSRGRIDPIKAATTAMSLALRMPVDEVSIYTRRGLRTL